MNRLIVYFRLQINAVKNYPAPFARNFHDYLIMITMTFILDVRRLTTAKLFL